MSFLVILKRLGPTKHLKMRFWDLGRETSQVVGRMAPRRHLAVLEGPEGRSRPHRICDWGAAQVQFVAFGGTEREVRTSPGALRGCGICKDAMGGSPKIIFDHFGTFEGYEKCARKCDFWTWSRISLSRWEAGSPGAICRLWRVRKGGRDITGGATGVRHL